MNNELKSCPSCGEMVSKYSISCPKCGANWQARALIKYLVPAFAVSLLIAGAVWAINKTSIDKSIFVAIIVCLFIGGLVVWSVASGPDSDDR